MGACSEDGCPGRDGRVSGLPVGWLRRCWCTPNHDGLACFAPVAVSQGGGAVYAQLTVGALNINGSTVANNSAYNGGGLVAVTQSCQVPNGGPCLTLDASTVDDMAGNQAVGGAGSAMLVTSLSRAQMTCGSAGNLASSLGSERNAPCRAQLRMANPVATGSPGLAAVGEAIRLCSLANDNLQGACVPHTGDEASAVNVTVAPGQPFNESAVVLDGFGQPLIGGVSDANLLMGVQLDAAESVDGGRRRLLRLVASSGGLALAAATAPDSLRQLLEGSGSDCHQVPTLLGNTTMGNNGTTFFPAITMFASPGEWWAQLARGWRRAMQEGSPVAVVRRLAAPQAAAPGDQLLLPCLQASTN